MTTQTDRSLSSRFERRTRDDGSTYVALHANSPDWLYDAVHAAHDGELPNDWRFKTAWNIVGLLEDGVEREEIADSLVDVYTHDLLAWLSADISRTGYCDEAWNDDLASASDNGIAGLIGLGQYLCIDAMVHVLADAIEANQS